MVAGKQGSGWNRRLDVDWVELELGRLARQRSDEKWAPGWRGGGDEFGCRVACKIGAPPAAHAAAPEARGRLVEGVERERPGKKKRRRRESGLGLQRLGLK